jgi:hypothetical protein
MTGFTTTAPAAERMLTATSARPAPAAVTRYCQTRTTT